MDLSKLILEQLSLEEGFLDKIKKTLDIVSYYKLVPYINLIKAHEDIFQKLQANKDISNKWEAVIYLYNYNSEISTSLYPLLALFETILKTRINNLLINTYTDYWFRDETLLLKVNRIDNINDLAIYNKYKDKECKNFDEEIKEDYNLINDQLRNLDKQPLGQNVIKEKIKCIKRCVYLYNESKKALCKNPRIGCLDFIENHVTLGYWLALLDIKDLWDKGACLKNIFHNFDNSLSDTQIKRKLENIRILRNKISHYAIIIGKNQLGGSCLIDVYKDLLTLFKLLDVDLKENAIFSNSDCQNCSFEKLYAKAEFIFEYEFPLLKTFKQQIIEMENVNSTYLKKAGYDQKERIFQVEFNTGEIYQYYSVPFVLYEKFINSESKGKSFIKNIRESFQYKKMDINNQKESKSVGRNN